MTDELDTKPLPEQAPKDAPPDTLQEGDIVADTPENLTIRVTALETEHATFKNWRQLFQESINSRFENLLTPEQIKQLIQASNQEVHTKINSLTASTERLIETNQQRTETVNGWMDAQRQAWHALFGRDITDKDSKQLTPSIFDRIAEVEKRANEADRRADAATLEVSENRADHMAAVDRADRARAEYEKYKPLFDDLQQKLDNLFNVQIEEQKRRERSRQLRDSVFKTVGELIKRPEFWGLFGAGGASAGIAVLKLLGVF